MIFSLLSSAFSQDETLQLAGFGSGQAVHDFDGPGVFVGRNGRLDVFLQSLDHGGVADEAGLEHHIGPDNVAALARKRVVWGKSVSVSEDLGGRRIMKKKVSPRQRRRSHLQQQKKKY